MSRCIRGKWLGLCLLLLPTAVSSAQAQNYPYYNRGTAPYQQPALSPYLNLLRSGDPAANYYLLVRPEFQQRALNAQFGQAIQSLDRRTSEPAETASDGLLSTLPSTGHPAVFMNHGGYFNTLQAPRAGTTSTPINRGRR